MKVLFVHEGYISKNNGEYFSLHYSNEIVRRYKTLGDKITFLTREEPYENNRTNQNKIEVPGFCFIGVKNYKSFTKFHEYPTVCETVREAVQNTDCLVARLPGDLGNLAVKYACQYGKKYLIELVGCPWDALWHHSRLGKVIAPFLYLKTREIVKNAPYVIYVTSHFLQYRYPTKGYAANCSDVLLNEVKPEILKQKMDTLAMLAAKPKIIIGTTGVVNLRYKGQQYVIRAISELTDYNFEYQVVGGGDNSYLWSVAQRYHVEEKVKFIGALPHEEVLNWLDSIDIYIQPSETEGLPRALIEAMGRACICIGSNAGGIPELLPPFSIFKKRNIRSLKKVLVNAVREGKNYIEPVYNESRKYTTQIIETRRRKILMDFLG